MPQPLTVRSVAVISKPSTLSLMVEKSVFISPSRLVHIGGEGYATNQAMPVLDDDGEPTDVLQQSWRVLIPLSLGVEYHFEGK